MEWSRRLSIQSLQLAGEGRRANTVFKMFAADLPVPLHIAGNALSGIDARFSEQARQQYRISPARAQGMCDRFRSGEAAGPRAVQAVSPSTTSVANEWETGTFLIFRSSPAASGTEIRNVPISPPNRTRRRPAERRAQIVSTSLWVRLQPDVIVGRRCFADVRLKSTHRANVEFP